MKTLFSDLLQFLVLIPATVFCYLPMKNQLRISVKQLVIQTSLLLFIAIPTLTALSVFAKMDSNLLLVVFLMAAFFYYRWTLDASLGQSLSIFVFVIALMSFPADMSLAFDAWIHPTETINDLCIQAPACQLLISVLLLVLLLPFLYRYGSRLIDSSQSRVWYLLLPIPISFLILNCLIEPRVYSTLYVGKVFIFYVSYILISLFMYLFIYLIFYFVDMELQQNYQNARRIHFYEMQEKQYHEQQQYLTETARLRHDFRQSIFTLQELAVQQDYAGVERYLKNFCQNLPSSEIKQYCRLTPVNALLNYYERQFKENQIRIAWNIAPSELLDKPCTLSDSDICGLLGNLLENGMHGCMTLPPDQRYHKLSATILHGQNLYISTINSFDGNVDKKGYTYLSNSKNGSGIGLSSIELTAKKYHGSATYSHTESEFFMDVVLKL